MPSPAPLLTTKDIAERAKVKPKTVREWVKQGIIKPIAKPGHHRFTETAWQDFIYIKKPIKLYV